MRFSLLPRVVCLGGLLSVAAVSMHAAAGETWEVQNTTYANVRVSEVTRATVTILHSGGITQLELAKLPEPLQERFGYDPEKAAAWKKETEARLATSTAEKRRNEAQRTAAGRAVARTGTPPASDVKGPVSLHESVDLRPIYTRHGLYLRSQGRRPSCSVFAVVSALEYEIARRRGTAEPLSEDYLIWATRRLHADVEIDDGFHFEEVLSALQSSGIPRQKTMPNTFGKKMEDIEPTPEALGEASSLRSVIPVWIRADDPRRLQRIIARINTQTPVVVGLRWPHASTLEQTALLSEQEPRDGAGHAVTLIGYKCAAGTPESVVFIFRNSWGVRWGTGGCGYVTSQYVEKNLITAFYLTLPDEASTVATAQ